MNDKYILQGHKAVPCDSMLRWAKWYGSSNRSVDKTEKSGVRVSTVFLGLNHNWGEGPPLLFETMIFGGKHDQYQERYSTWEEAEEGHKRACELAFETEK